MIEKNQYVDNNGRALFTQRISPNTIISIHSK